MSTWLDTVAAGLDRAGEPVTFFFRDDDAGWDDAGLLRLLDAFEARRAPIDAAAIPAALSPTIVDELARRVERGAIGLHQHGWTHTDHQRAGRKCEFGSDRDHRQQHADIAAGRQRLRDLFATVEPVFTPPWNRCTPTTAECLVELGFGVLSRDVGATPFAQPGLVELPISVDWFAGRNGVRLGLGGGGGLGELIAARVATGTPVGVMLHHAVTAVEDLDAIGDLVTLLVDHPNSDVALISAIAPITASITASAAGEVVRPWSRCRAAIPTR
jgi:peptidoglycan/xylan/chitin deacetylase (PgdA/CDA1 family)